MGRYNEQVMVRFDRLKENVQSFIFISTNAKTDTPEAIHFGC